MGLSFVLVVSRCRWDHLDQSSLWKASAHESRRCSSASTDGGRELHGYDRKLRHGAVYESQRAEHITWRMLSMRFGMRFTSVSKKYRHEDAHPRVANDNRAMVCLRLLTVVLDTCHRTIHPTSTTRSSIDGITSETLLNIVSSRRDTECSLNASGHQGMLCATSMSQSSKYSRSVQLVLNTQRSLHAVLNAFLQRLGALVVELARTAESALTFLCPESLRGRELTPLVLIHTAWCREFPCYYTWPSIRDPTVFIRSPLRGRHTDTVLSAKEALRWSN
ncbi:hypothetical protein BDW22DRAFT_1348418 [Trametopsis cervina]|nr:hypothetical protein BDW22DRAFT_1348418 [Trametopsis cervina]